MKRQHPILRAAIRERQLRALALAARPDLPPVPVAASWGKPVVDLLGRITSSLKSSDSDPVILSNISDLVSSVPSLAKSMDIAALAAAYEAGMGASAILGAVQSLDKLDQGNTVGFAADDSEELENLGIVIAPLKEAVAKLDQRTPVAAKLSSAEWARVPVALRERAQFSARVDSVRFLSEVQTRIQKRLSLEKDNLANGKQAYMDRSVFIAEMRAIAEEENLVTAGEGEEGSIRDIRSAKRLGLIYDMQTQQAQEFARWKMDQDPDVLDAYPAQRFVRIEMREKPREDWPDRWSEAGGAVNWEGAMETDMVALKTSPIWQTLSRFGTPWPPFDFGSGMGLEDIERDEAEAIGLLTPGQKVEPVEKDLNAELDASVKDLPEESREWLAESFGDQIQMDEEGERIVWRGAAEDQAE